MVVISHSCYWSVGRDVNAGGGAWLFDWHSVFSSLLRDQDRHLKGGGDDLIARPGQSVDRRELTRTTHRMEKNTNFKLETCPQLV
ncbi:hypothetical protein CHARACLAT_018613 [Characodon lateralis]|uniref:Uncharacterized protein n=1 Tax=Characodon lateralis TaxID=208331 RepID=A0ABU7E3Q0_9TELE|nr:hypothetical protein [Characodon lateralis]